MGKKPYIIFGALGGLAIMLLLALIGSLFLDIKHASRQLVSIKQEIAVLETQNREIEDFKKVYPDYQYRLLMMEQSFVDPKNPLDFIKFLEATAKEAGVTPKISLLSAALRGNTGAMAFQVFFSEDFLDILDVSKKIENGPFALLIESITINSSSQEISSDNYPSGKVDATLLIQALTSGAFAAKK